MVSIEKEFGDVSVEGQNKYEVIDNLRCLQSLGENVDEKLGFDVKMPENVLNKLYPISDPFATKP